MNNRTLQEKIWKALKKYGISNEQELDKALRDLKPLNIGCFVNVLNQSESSGEIRKK